jgi:hypothetical protein
VRKPLSRGILWTACAALLPSVLTAFALKDSCDGGICIQVVESEDEVELSCTNPLVAPVQIWIDYDELDQIRAVQGGPTPRSVKPGATELVGRLQAREELESARYSYRWRYLIGSPQAAHDPAARYLLPFHSEEPVELIQGVDGSFSHRSRYAFDFELPEGTPVRAARSGAVVWLTGKHSTGRPDPAIKDEANRVLILHEDGTLGRYLHLQQGAEVRIGDHVEAGQIIGTSGNTGFSDWPHLHFDVVRATDSGVYETVPIRFRSEDPDGFVPEEGERYTSRE